MRCGGLRAEQIGVGGQEGGKRVGVGGSGPPHLAQVCRQHHRLHAQLGATRQGPLVSDRRLTRPIHSTKLQACEEPHAGNQHRDIRSFSAKTRAQTHTHTHTHTHTPHTHHTQGSQPHLAQVRRQHHRLHAQLGAVAQQDIQHARVVALRRRRRRRRRAGGVRRGAVRRSVAALAGGAREHVVCCVLCTRFKCSSTCQRRRLLGPQAPRPTWHASSRGLRPAASHFDGSAPLNSSASTTSCGARVRACVSA